MKVEGWTYEIEQLSEIFKTHPHAAYTAYTHGLSHKWKFLLRTMPNIGNLLTPLETAVRHSLIPSITGKNDLNDHMRRIMALPTHLGGLGLDNPQRQSNFEYSASRKVCNPISELILQQSGSSTLTHSRSKGRQGRQSGRRGDKLQQRTPDSCLKSFLRTAREWSTSPLKRCVQLVVCLACGRAWFLPPQDSVQGHCLSKVWMEA